MSRRRKNARRKRPRVTLPTLSAEARGPDPIVHRRPTTFLSVVITALLVVAALAAHVGLALAIVGAKGWLGEAAEDQDSERVEVAVIEAEAEPLAPEPEPEAEAEQPEAAAVTPPPVERPLAPAPPPPPTDRPEPPAAEPARRIVGLNMESTVQGGSGPAFATGSTQEGKTETTAVDPREAARKPPPSSAPPTPSRPSSGNRAATRVPSESTTFEKPKRQQRIKPGYPALYREQGIEGQVVVEVLIDASGNVAEAKILGPSPHDEFNAAALAAAKKEKFSPAKKNGVATPYRLSFTYRFRLSDG